jgi:hypothetical protein
MLGHQPLTYCDRTFPTTYVAYPSPFIVVESPISTPISTCITIISVIRLPASATPQVVFAMTDKNPTPGSSALFSLLDSLPTVSSILSGGNPTSCYQGFPITSLFATGLPSNIPGITSVYTTVAILTKVGDPVTLATNPFPGDVGVQSEGGSIATALPDVTGPANNSPAPSNNPGTTLPPQTTFGSGPTTVIGGITFSPGPSGVVIADGQTLDPGAVTTIGSLPVSVGSGGNVVVAGSSVSVPTALQSGPVLASGAGISAVGSPDLFRPWKIAWYFVAFFWSFLFGIL